MHGANMKTVDVKQGSAFIYSELHTRTTCQNNINLVHVNGHDRIILVIFSQALYKAP